jgi:alpha-1,6-mannosyltransferase
MGFERDPRRLASALASADFFVHACPFETFGLGVAQAIASGLPLVVPNEGGASEQVDETFAERFRSKDGQACAEAMHRLWTRRGPSMKASALGAARRVTDVREQVERTVDIYRELLQNAYPRKADHGSPHLVA